MVSNIVAVPSKILYLKKYTNVKRNKTCTIVDHLSARFIMRPLQTSHDIRKHQSTGTIIESAELFYNICLSLAFCFLRRPDTVKQKNAFPPNFIHSLDSTHMMLTSLYCYRYQWYRLSLQNNIMYYIIPLTLTFYVCMTSANFENAIITSDGCCMICLAIWAHVTELASWQVW